MLMNGIPNFVLEKNVLEAEIDVLKQMGVEIRCGTEVGKDITIRQLREDGYKAFYLAIGLSGGRKTNVPGEDSEGVESAVSFLNRSSQDVHESMQGDVIVIGGGNVAVDVARTASRLTEGKVTMLCLEGEHEMPASEAEVAAAEADGVVVKNGWGPKEILTENGKAVGVLFKKCTQVKDADGRFNPQYDENETLTIQGAHVLEAIGQSAVWGSLLKDENVELYKNGYIKADPTTFQTSQDDIFTGGDIYHGAKFAIDAIAEGKLASESMHRFVHHGQSLTIGRDLRQFSELDKDNLDIEGYDNAKRQIPGRKKTDDPFKDPSVPLTEEQVRTEAKRCLSCGATTVDLNRCIGCGLCTTRCEFDAIHLERDLPDASRMLRSEDKMKLVLPYAAKREMKILFKRKQK
jgi:NADPH-dependent glutamate synthase beta subunit-like oxidoreductase